MTAQTSPQLIGPRRRSFQWAITLLILLLPWVRPDDVSLLRIDIPTLSLHLFGQVLRIEELYLFLIFTLAFAVAFLLLTLVFGRVWCGWACPQTTLNDVAEWLIRRLQLKPVGRGLQGPLISRLLLHIAYLSLALLVASNLLWYFIEPSRYFKQLLQGELHVVAIGTLLIVAATIYLDLAFIRRLMCSDFCPYGRFQSALADQATLTLHRPDSEAPRCIDCGTCVRSCPMGIDIREGEQIECINCGRCLDACRVVMAKRHQPGLIRYSFGHAGRGARALLSPRSLLLTIALTTLTLLLIITTTNRLIATLKVAHSHAAGSRILADGQQATFFNLWVNNRAKLDATFSILVRSNDLSPLEIKGPVANVRLKPGENRRLDVVVVALPPKSHRDIEFVLLQGETEIAVARGQLLAETHN